MKSNYLTSVSFSDFALNPDLDSALSNAGFTFCTEIQHLSLPLMLEGKDVAAQSQTGTGKTAAFLLGMYQHMLNNPLEDSHQATQGPTKLRAIILAPTRELAIQIHKDAEQLGANTNFKTVLAYGGTDYEKQRRKIQDGADVLIGTPGRIIDYFKQKVFSLKEIQVVVLDEADRMFDLGFIADIRFLLRRMPDPEQRLNLLFSATLSHRVMELAYEHMNNPVGLKTESDRIAAEKVNQMVYHPASDEKIPLLLGLMQKMQPQRSIVFVNTKRVAERVQAYLVGNNIPAEVLSGDVRQNKRQRLIKDLASGDLNTLIATDVAARGLHIDGVTHVFNYALPQNPEDYVHHCRKSKSFLVMKLKPGSSPMICWSSLLPLQKSREQRHLITANATVVVRVAAIKAITAIATRIAAANRNLQTQVHRRARQKVAPDLPVQDHTASNSRQVNFWSVVPVSA